MAGDRIAEDVGYIRGKIDGMDTRLTAVETKLDNLRQDHAAAIANGTCGTSRDNGLSGRDIKKISAFVISLATLAVSIIEGIKGAFSR